MTCLTFSRSVLPLLGIAGMFFAGGLRPVAAESSSLNLLFIGNSYTARHNLALLVKDMAEAGNPGLRCEVTTVIYGGRTLKDHWRVGTANHVKFAALTPAAVRATIRSLEESVAKDPKDALAVSAIAKQQALLASLDGPRRKWDVVVLQSHRDDLQGEASAYAEYAPKFAALVRDQGGRVVLYETTSSTQNAAPLTAAPAAAPILAKARMIAALAARLDAAVVPMSMVALHCQTVRPDLTLRFVNDGHLNHTMAYLTACTFQAALFGRSPVGLSVGTVTDTRSLDDANRDKDRDGQPITRVYSEAERTALQRIAWEGYQKFRQLAAARK